MFLFLHRKTLMCMGYLHFRIKLGLNFGKIVAVLDLQLVDVSKTGLREFLRDIHHFESFLCFITFYV